MLNLFTYYHLIIKYIFNNAKWPVNLISSPTVDRGNKAILDPERTHTHASIPLIEVSHQLQVLQLCKLDRNTHIPVSLSSSDCSQMCDGRFFPLLSKIREVEE